MSQAQSSAPDSTALVSASVHKYVIKKKKTLSSEEAELYELSQAAGVVLDQEVFKIILDLLKMNVAPQAVFLTLKAMCAGQRVSECITDSSSAAHTTPAAPADVRVRCKTAPSHSERSKESTVQRVQRQPSANRGQKTKSSGSSSSSSHIHST